jgi:hypothetical protein
MVSRRSADKTAGSIDTIEPLSTAYAEVIGPVGSSDRQGLQTTLSTVLSSSLLARLRHFHFEISSHHLYSMGLSIDTQDQVGAQ